MAKDFFYVGGGAAKTPQEVAFLKTKYEVFDKQLITEIFQDVLNLKVIEVIKPEIVGLPHITYFVKVKVGTEYCFRANLGNEKPEVELLIEKLISDLVKKSGVQSNTILYVDCSRKKYPFDFQIQEKLSGNNPEYNFVGNRQDYDKLSFELGQIIGKLASIQMDGFGRFDKDIARAKNVLVTTLKTNYEYISLELESQIQSITDAKLINKHQENSLLNIFEESKPLINISKGSVVHYDLADHNFFYDPKTFQIVGIFDWEAVCVSDPLLDLGSVPTWKTLFERETKLLEGFSSITKLPENYQEKINLYKLRTVIWKVVHNLKFDLMDKERLDRFYNVLKLYKI